MYVVFTNLKVLDEGGDFCGYEKVALAFYKKEKDAIKRKENEEKIPGRRKVWVEQVWEGEDLYVFD